MSQTNEGSTPGIQGSCPHSAMSSGWVSALLVDGSRQAVSLEDADVGKMLRYTKHIKTLYIEVPFDSFGDRAIQGILDQPMPLLEELRIKGDISPEGGMPARAPSTIRLRSHNLPRLYHLVADDVLLDLDPTLCSNLRCIDYKLRHDAPSRWPLAQFLNMMRSGVRLEEVVIDECLDITLPRGQPTLPVVSLQTHRFLRKLHVFEYSPALEQVIDHLIIPGHINSVTLGLYHNTARDWVHELSQLLSRNGCARAIPHEPTELSVRVDLGGEDPAMLVRFPEGGTLTVMLVNHDTTLTDDLFPPPGTSLSVRDQFKAKVLAMGALRGASVTTIDLCGAMDVTTKEDWLIALRLYSGVRHMDLENISGSPERAYIPILSALSTRPGGPHTPLLCPNLESMTFDDVCNRADFLETIDHFLQQRALAGGPRLKKLSLELSSDVDPRWSRSEKARRLMRSIKSRVDEFYCKVT
ncbi:hypothetical protein C8Q77DRAFT_1075719 [Trametes polyzona]|nr:hypothetical protein C8Q77DRAFT_1075719 [Trametes polyzona]